MIVNVPAHTGDPNFKPHLVRNDVSILGATSFSYFLASVLLGLSFSFAQLGCTAGGLSGSDQEETPEEEEIPEATTTCGDGVRETGEACDDGNATAGDGCNATCTEVEPLYECAIAGLPCIISCGNGSVDTSKNEMCDDGNRNAGDGCDATCQPEAGYTCPTPGQPCVEATECGNGDVETGASEACDDGDGNENSYGSCALNCQFYYRCGDGLIYNNPADHVETCDDGNAISGDGCSATCQIESGFVCRNIGQACTVDTCGNGSIEAAAGEYCDDGNTVSGDGCSSNCVTVESGWYCWVAGQPCGAASCSDGIVAGNEQCDDGNSLSGDGCSNLCQLEVGYDCPTAGQACATITCGDGSADGLETCDDGEHCSDGSTCTDDSDCTGIGDATCTTRSSDGCDANCAMELGYVCQAGGGACSTTPCGDGQVLGSETCDDGEHCSDGSDCSDDSDCTGIGDATCQARSSDGCSDSCVLEDGYACPTPGADCVTVTCGDGATEGTEDCDDGKHCEDGTECDEAADCAGIGDNACLPRAGDGCDPLCRTEAIYHCSSGAGCSPVCGDGVTIYPDETCDDGNLTAGDGCAANCTSETGYTCTDYTVATPTEIQVPITYRDFDVSHPDFQAYSGSGATTGLVENDLGEDGIPVFLSTHGSGTYGQQLTSETRFNEWYRDISGTNYTFLRSLTLTQDLVLNPSGTTYVFDSAPLGSHGGFYPINDLGFGNYSGGRNYHFTSEMRAYFRYEGGEVLDFRGDDDVWVYINGSLAVDLGGLHPPSTGSVTLANTVDPATGLVHDSRFNIYEGGIYEIALFQAERAASGSNYKLTLAGFVNTGTSFCVSTCGDGLLRGAEECDDGNTTNGDGCDDSCETEPLYICTGEPSTCIKPPCGNNTVEPPEQCDDGNLSDSDGCSSSCLLEDCGDGNVDPFETCDDGNTVDGDACTNACQPATCGDGVVRTGVEECDDGNTTDTDLCTNACTTAVCGDSIVGPGETCDDGTNNGGYGSCLFGCLGRAPHCGDGSVQAAFEACDAGTAFNTGAYNGCNADCTRAGYCGDGTLQGSNEQCDDGNTTDGDGCSAQCNQETFGGEL